MLEETEVLVYGVAVFIAGFEVKEVKGCVEDEGEVEVGISSCGGGGKEGNMEGVVLCTHY